MKQILHIVASVEVGNLHVGSKTACVSPTEYCPDDVPKIGILLLQALLWPLQVLALVRLSNELTVFAASKSPTKLSPTPQHCC